MEGVNHRKISIDAEKASNKFQYPFITKTFQKTGTEQTYLNTVNAIYDKTTANIILNSEKLKAFSLEQDKGARSGQYYST